ncbi:hypothetical protein QBC37DRAFT_26845 [Rhypophila decipiens]|uniref:Ubiquitin-like 1-activating enzyme E1A n=1 Tax=Rhypophila decipiens TaxID=261697 RepID=A0AAN6YEU0_9PEZI|nr:hypothetical protein QBC37DRAFT_26845 [Rhypophila decipiens]
MADQAQSNGSVVGKNSSKEGISADEIALYDRQIRLWGMKAQERIRNANILLITMKALANEIAKNLVLAGIGSLTIVDHEVVTEPDLGAQFFLNSSHLGLNRAEAASSAIQRLNPRVKIHVSTSDIRTQVPSFFSQFDIIIATDIDSPQTLDLINTATRLNSRPFYAASSVGFYGFVFADLIEHEFVIERAKSNLPTKLGPETRTRSVVAVSPKPDNPAQELVTKRELYSTWLLASDLASLPPDILKSPRRRKIVTPILSCLRALWEYLTLYGTPPDPNNRAAIAQFTVMCTEKHKALGLPVETLKSDILRSFLQNINAEIAPVTAVVGGQLAQDVINVLGATQQPIQNFVIFDGNSMEAHVYTLHPEGPLGKALFNEESSGVDAAAAVANAVDAAAAAAAAHAAIMAGGGLGPVMPPDMNMFTGGGGGAAVDPMDINGAMGSGFAAAPGAGFPQQPLPLLVPNGTVTGTDVTAAAAAATAPVSGGGDVSVLGGGTGSTPGQEQQQQQQGQQQS